MMLKYMKNIKMENIFHLIIMKRTIKLIEYGALKVGLKDFSDEELKTLALMPSLKESNEFYLVI